jgi:hypothetical protein
MVWSEYVNETVWEDAWSDEDADGDHLSTRISCDDWTTWYSEHLMNMWMTIRDHHEVRYARLQFGYTEFCEFAWNFSADAGDGRSIVGEPYAKSGEVWVMWLDLVRYLRDSGVRHDVMNHATFQDFAGFYYSWYL